MTFPTLDPTTPVNQTATGSNPNNPPNLQDQILNHISSLKALVQLHNESPIGLVRPIRLSFDNEGGPKEKNDEAPEDLRKPYKEVLKSPFSRWIIEFSSLNHQTPTILKIYDGSIDPDDHITCFCCKDPTKVSKIIRKANETLPGFKERWTEEISYIPDVPIVMQISSFMRNSKCPELARRFFDQVPKTVTEMMKRDDDFVKSEEAFKNTKLPKGKHPEKGITTQFRGSRPPLHPYGNGPLRLDAYNLRDHYQPYVPPRAPDRRYDNKRHDHRRKEFNHLRLDSLTKLPSEILATELLLQLLPCPPTVAPSRKENLNRVVSSTVHAMMKFPTPKGIATLCARAKPVYECWWSERKVAKQEETKEKEKRKGPNTEGEEKIPVNPAFLEQTVTIDTQFSAKCCEQLIHLLNNNIDMFAWQPSDMVGVPRRLIKHALIVNNSVSPVAQKRRVLGTEKSRVVTREVWVKARIRPVKYPTWISNPILVKKVDDTWRMCIDFKNLNAACPKDYYPLSKIDLKIEVVVGHPLKSFLDPYKGYHQVQMSEEDEEKTAFYTDQGTY
ncbi:hypothetical protein Tco_0852018 [Tanacetum coccineum]